MTPGLCFQLNRDSLLLHFTLSELFEISKKEYTEISTLFDGLLARLETHHQTIDQEFDQERAALLQSLMPQAKGPQNEEEWDGERREKEREAQKEREKLVDSKIGVKRRRELRKIRHAVTLTWIIYMRTARRVQVTSFLILIN